MHKYCRNKKSKNDIKVSKALCSQCIVLSVEAKKVSKDCWEAYTHNGREKTNLKVNDWIKKAIDLGIGEVILTSVDFDGTGDGFDYDLVSQISKICEVPLIISGGLGNLDHIKEVLKKK